MISFQPLTKSFWNNYFDSDFVLLCFEKNTSQWSHMPRHSFWLFVAQVESTLFNVAPKLIYLMRVKVVMKTCAMPSVFPLHSTFNVVCLSKSRFVLDDLFPYYTDAVQCLILLLQFLSHHHKCDKCDWHCDSLHRFLFRFNVRMKEPRRENIIDQNQWTVPLTFSVHVAPQIIFQCGFGGGAANMCPFDAL